MIPLEFKLAEDRTMRAVGYDDVLIEYQPDKSLNPVAEQSPFIARVGPHWYPFQRIRDATFWCSEMALDRAQFTTKP